jgi:type IV fimbrial biogenesis protein FimT
METTDETVVKRMSGFTLVEMVVVMTIAAILVGIGVPSFRYVTTSNRMSGEINGLLGDMQYARSEALKEGQIVTICSSIDGANCGNAPWDKGWFIFSDPTNAKTGGAALRVQKGFLGGDTLQFDNGASAITFNREGFAVEPMSVATAAITATLHDKTNNAGKTRCLVITAGRITTEMPGPASATQLRACQ